MTPVSDAGRGFCFARSSGGSPRALYAPTPEVKMSIMRLLIVSVLLLITPHSHSQAQTAASPGYSQQGFAAALSLLKAMDLEKDWLKNLNQIVSQLAGNDSSKQEQMNGFFTRFMGYKKLEADLARIYAKQFTVSELNELTAFYSTPVGRKWNDRKNVIALESIKLAQDLMRQHQGEIDKIRNTPGKPGR